MGKFKAMLVFIPNWNVNKTSKCWKFSEGAEQFWLNFHGGDSARHLQTDLI